VIRTAGGRAAQDRRAGSRLQDHHAQEASHLFFANGLGSAFMSLLATHPPLEDRIRRLQPAAAVEGIAAGHATQRAVPAGAQGFAGGAPEPAAGASSAAPAAATGAAGAAGAGAAGAALIAAVGAPQPQHVAYAHRLLESLPDDVLAAAHEPERAMALLFALLLGDGAAAASQRSIIETGRWSLSLADTERLAPQVRAAGQAARLPLLDLLLPALRELPPPQRDGLRETAEQLVLADGRVDMFELALLHVLKRQLGADRQDHRPPTGPRSLEPLEAEAVTLLSAVAWSGTQDVAAAGEAFETGAASLQPALRQLTLLPADGLVIARIDAALERVRTASAAVRRRIIEACMLTVAHDGRVATQEAEMLRAIAEAIDLPMPPIPG
jgi:hypothetical protein